MTTAAGEHALIRTIARTMSAERDRDSSIEDEVTIAIEQFLRINYGMYPSEYAELIHDTVRSEILPIGTGRAGRISRAVLSVLDPALSDLSQRLIRAAGEPTHRAAALTYQLAWSEELEHFVATTDAFPDFKGHGSTPVGALDQLQREVVCELERLDQEEDLVQG